MDWDRLDAFMAVARAGGFTAASRQVGRTQSALSQAVLALEAQLGQQLLIRSRRGATPTEAGQLLLAHARRAYDELSLAQGRLQALDRLDAGRLRVGTSDTLGVHLLPPVLRAYRARYPGIELTLSAAPSPATARAVAERKLDVGVASVPLPADLRIGGQPAGDALRIAPLLPQPDVVITAPTHRLGGRRRLRVAELEAVPLLLLGRDTAGRRFLDRQFEAAGVRPLVQMEMDSVELLKRLVELDFGAAVVPALAVQQEVERGSLRSIALIGLRRRREVALLLPARGPVSRAAAAFEALVRETLVQPDCVSR